jgi:lysophospholipase L1-like esterase
MLRSTRPLNVDPPVLHRPADAPVPERVARYLERETRLSYRYTTDREGHRTTLPAVDAEEQILVVGDSVLFGVGVDDEFTIASQLQRDLGDGYRIVNAGVGGYDGRQVATVAERMSRERRWAGLVYVACRNDFTEHEDWNGEAAAILDRLAALRDRFSGNIVVVLHTYMEYTLHDFFLDRGERREFIDGIHALRAAVARLAEEHGFEFIDWTDMVNAYMRKSGTVFAPFALYADHCHLSPLGNRLLAEGVAAKIERRWLATALNHAARS